jgi:alkylhydroperoxidase/carboxymuconolactone decarboxylase family protein YurZ
MTGKDVWTVFSEECPQVAEAYLKLFKEMNVGESLDQKTLCLVLVGINSATRDPLSTRFWARRAKAAGATKKQVESAALLAWCQGVSSAEMSVPLILEAFES